MILNFIIINYETMQQDVIIDVIKVPAENAHFKSTITGGSDSNRLVGCRHTTEGGCDINAVALPALEQSSSDITSTSEVPAIKHSLSAIQPLSERQHFTSCGEIATVTNDQRSVGKLIPDFLQLSSRVIIYHNMCLVDIASLCKQLSKLRKDDDSTPPLTGCRKRSSVDNQTEAGCRHTTFGECDITAGGAVPATSQRLVDITKSELEYTSFCEDVPKLLSGTNTVSSATGGVVLEIHRFIDWNEISKVVKECNQATAFQTTSQNQRVGCRKRRSVAITRTK